MRELLDVGRMFSLEWSPTVSVEAGIRCAYWGLADAALATEAI
jgi:hypothetical protein